MWYLEDICNLLKACVIIHNMIVEYNRSDDDATQDIQDNQHTAASNQGHRITLFGFPAEDYDAEDQDMIHEVFAERVGAFSETMQDAGMHRELKADLLQHLWEQRNAGNH